MNAGNRRELNKFRYNVSKIQRLSILLVSLGVVAGTFNGTGTEDRQGEKPLTEPQPVRNLALV